MSAEEETKLPEKEEPVDTRPSLFGTIHLPQRSLSRRYLSARIGKGVFVSIAVMCGIVLVTLLSQISEEAFVPEEEIEVDGVRYPVKTVAQTQLSWKAETYDPTWDADDLRQERSNVTIEASWVETSFEAFNNKGERFTSLQGESTFDLEEDLERALCNSGLAPITYKPVEPWNIFDLLPNEEQEGLAYDTGASTRINIFNRSTAPTAGMGDFWVDSDDGSRWVWKGLRWDSAEDDVFLDGVLEFISPYPEAFADGKLWVHYTPVEPLFRGDGDLWLNRSATGVSTFSDVELASIYNKSNKSWDIIDFTQLPAAVLDPQSTIKTFVPEFCTKAETSAYILTSGQVGAAVIGEFSNENGYQIEPTADSGRSKTIELTVAITPTGASSSSVSIVDGAFDIAHVELKPSGGLSTHWLFISHTMNYTVTYVQTAGPAADARETSYNEIGGFALGDPLDWFQIRFIDDVDLDNDGIRDVCDDDIDGDNAENPVQGHPEHCPGVGRYAMGTTPLSYADWIAQNDENNDGVHDEVKDRDIDGDGVPNLVDGQGHSAEKAFEGRTSLAEIPELWLHASELAVSKCAENYKSNDPSFAAFDCENAKEMVGQPPTSAQAWCEQVRYLDQLIWLEKCAAPQRTESGEAMYEERDPTLPLFGLLGLVGMLLVMRKPNTILMRLRSMFIALGSEELENDVLTKWSYCSFAAELIGRLVGIALRLVFFIVFASMFLSTFAENQQTLLIPFTFTIGGAVTIMSGIALLVSISQIFGIRPETRVPRADGLVDLGLLLFTGIVIFIALQWVFIEGWLVGAIMLLLIMSGVKRLVLAGLQLTRTDNIQFDRLKLVVKGRQGWITASLVLLTIGFFTIPLAVHIPFVWSDYTSSEPYKAGLRAAFWGSVYVVGYTMLFAIPLSIGAAIWLEEYAPNNRLRRTIQALITNLAGVPAIVFGLFGLAMFLTDRGIGLGLGGTVMTAGMTMATMAMPTIVISSQEALRAVPPSLRNGAFGLGCTKWQVTKDHVLPHAMPGMMTGTILAMSRIMGEAAPLILVGAVASVFTEPDAFFYVSYQVTPSLDGLFAWFPGIEPHLQNIPLLADRGPFSSDPSEYVGPDSNDRGFYTVLPVQVYRWTDMPAIGFKVAAAGASLVLLGTLVIVNSAAILLRAHFRRYSKT